MVKQYQRLTYIILIHLFVVYPTTQTFAQNPLDTVFIKNYNNADYHAAGLNYTGLKDSEGYYFFANENGVLKYDGSKWQLINVKNFAATFSLAQGHDGRIYVGSMNEFGYLEKQDNQYVYQSLSEVVNKSTEEVWQIVVVNDGVYFGSYEGIFRYDGKDIHFIDLHDAHIFKIGNKVVASVFNGGIYELKNDKPILKNNDLNLLDDAIYAILPSFHSSNYLIMTSENGIWEMDTTDYTLTKLNIAADQLLKSKGIYDAVPIMNNMYAISTWFGGVFIINADGEVVLNVEKTYGLASSETRELFTDQRGHLWVATTSGISHLYWNKQLFEDGYEPTTVITDKVISYAADSSMVGVTFHFATPGFEKFELEYRYFLEGFEENYSDWTKEVKKEYTNLNGGEYTFYVQAKLPTGEITAETLSSIQVPTPWYLNKWFMAAIIAGIAIIVLSVYKIRTKSLKQLNSRLEKIIDNRTKELIEQREQLKVINKELKITNSELDNFVYRSSHDLVAPLKSLKGLVHLARLEDTDQQLTPYLDKMDTSVVKLEDFIKSIMEYSTNTKSELSYQPIELNSVIDSIMEDLRFYTNADIVAIQKNYAPDFVIKSDIKRLHIILSNLITNAIKYHNYDQEKPFIEIKAISDEEKVEIQIKDNGLGIDDEHLNHIFNMFYRASENGEGSGLGLYIVQDTIELLSGGISVKSKVGKGTTFTILLPHYT